MEGEAPESRDSSPDSIELSYDELTPQAARLHRLLAAYPWPTVGVGAAAAVAGGEPADVRPLLDELVSLHLLQETGQERYRYHELIRQFAAERALHDEGPGGAGAAIRRMVEWYLRTAAAADAVLVPGGWRIGPVYDQLQGQPPAFADSRTALTALQDERANLAAAVCAAEEYGLDALVWELCETLWGLQQRLGDAGACADLYQRAVEAAVRCADGRAEGRMRHQLACTLLDLDRLEEAEDQLMAAARAARLAGHPRGEAAAADGLGLLRLRQERYEEAHQLFAAAREIAGLAGGTRALALLQQHAGQALRGQGRHPEAVRELEAARELMRALPDRHAEARVLTLLGATLLDAGDAAAAVAPLDEALAVLEAEGGWSEQVEAAELRARCARALGDPAGEERHLRAAAGLRQRHGSRAG